MIDYKPVTSDAAKIVIRSGIYYVIDRDRLVIVDSFDFANLHKSVPPFLLKSLISFLNLPNSLLKALICTKLLTIS